MKVNLTRGQKIGAGAGAAGVIAIVAGVLAWVFGSKKNSECDGTCIGDTEATEVPDQSNDVTEE